MSSEASTYGDPDTRQRILAATWILVSERGAGFKLRDVAQTSGVSRQAVYLHFGDRAGLLVGLVQHMDDVLDLGASLGHVFEAPTSTELLQRAMRLNTEFWHTVAPVAQVLHTAQHDDQAVADAWRDRMRFRQQAFGMMIQRIADNGQLATGWTIERGTTMLYAVAGFETWHELTRELGWDHDTYIEEMTRLLTRAMLS